MSSLTMGESFIETSSPEESEGGCLAPPEQRKVRLDSSISTKVDSLPESSGASSRLRATLETGGGETLLLLLRRG